MVASFDPAVLDLEVLMDICPAYDTQFSAIGRQVPGPLQLHSGLTAY